MLRRVSVVGLAALICASAQPQDPGGRGRGRFGGGTPPPFPIGARLMGAEAGAPGRVVKGAPYSADVITETTQAFPDGNRIHQINTMRVYRDSEGRTRREQSLNSLNGLVPQANLPAVVFINDPVSGTNYALTPSDRTATRTEWKAPPSGGNRGPRRSEPNAIARRGGADSNLKTESLGKQNIDGIPVEGTRATMTIPSGQIGNEQPIQVVTENWYSPDLQAYVLTKRSDPRSGETVTRLSNVSRVEPAKTLFEVPADYKVSDAPRSRNVR